MTIAQLREKCHAYMKVKPGEEEKYEQFWRLNHYVAGAYDSEASFKALNKELRKQEQAYQVTHRLFYLALPPSVFEKVTVHIRNVCMGDKYVCIIQRELLHRA